MNTLIVGSGAASLNCADHLHALGARDIVIVTESLTGGVSRQSGSDKQTYHKTSVAATDPDSVRQHALTLFEGGAMDGDLALVEATCSLQEFYHLVQIGVPFPHDSYGAFPGYKTDHDPLQRATSAGPRTSHLMFERLLEQVQARGIPVMDRHLVIALLTRDYDSERHVVGAVAIDMDGCSESNFGLVVLHAENTVFGVGGPGGLYEASVYPESHTGGIGVALKAGAIAQNLTESQHGLASLKFRWNVSGTYQQALPRYVSTGADGGDEQEFLNPCFPSMTGLTKAVFLKGYQWPFDPRRLANYGSSLIDVLVHQERETKRRRVWLDYRRNPSGDARLGSFSLDALDEEVAAYLSNSGAMFGTPIERLAKMNPLAIELYRDHGIDLEREPLEIAVCAQHNNGGLRGNLWWESNLRHLFPIGEVNGSHGVYRPGGSALNAGQVGGLRAAQFIAARYAAGPHSPEEFLTAVRPQVEAILQRCGALLSQDPCGGLSTEEVRAEVRARMTRYGAHVRSPEGVASAVREARELWRRAASSGTAATVHELPKALQTESLVLAHLAYLESIKAYLDRGGGSRGSYLVTEPTGEWFNEALGQEWRFRPDVPQLMNEILETRWNGEVVETRWRPVRRLPKQDHWFETVWEAFRRGEVFNVT